MYKLLVVDDEPIHRRELASLIRTLRNNYEVCEAGNGKEALEMLNNSDFNILVTDVKMPLMDGLELMEALGERIEKLKVVVLSGYEYFDYAKRALKLGACDYVLKPIDEDAVEAMLQNVESLIEKQMNNDKAKELLQQQVDKSYPMYIDYMMNRFTNGMMNEEEMQKIEDIFSRVGQGRVFALYLYGLNNASMDIACPDKQDSLKSFLRYMLHSQLKQYGHTVSFFLDGQCFLVIGILKPNGNEESSYLFSLENEFHKLFDIIRQRHNVKIRVGISNLHACLYDHYKMAADEAMNALDFGFYSEEPIVFFCKWQEAMLSSAPLKAGTAESELKDAIIKCSRNKVLECFEVLVAALKTNIKPVPSILKCYIEEVLTGCLNSITLTVEKSSFDDISKKLKNIALCGDFCMLIETAREIVNDIIQSTEEMAKNKNHILIQKCIDYITEHFSEDMNVDMLANKFHFNNSYFSTIFKKNMGIGLSEYIFEARMEKALQLLKNSDIKVYEVAQKVGFRDEKYFCKAFKSKYGVTPNHSRRFAEAGRDVP